MSDNKKIIKRVYYAIELELAFPLSMSNGINMETDSDLLKTRDGRVFIPGSSIAGALRSKIDPSLREKLAGFSMDNGGRMSKLYVSDLCFEKGVESVRDGVQLNPGKTVENKFDFEVIETGAAGVLFLNYLVREEDDEAEFSKIIHSLLNGIADGQIRFGSNKNRGYGRLKVVSIRRKEFDKKNRDEYIGFVPRDVTGYGEKEEYDSWKTAHAENLDHYCNISVPLKLTGGISIRKYSARPNEADYMQITIGGESAADKDKLPVIPGTSWNGAIRADALDILKELGVKNAENYINQWFGHVHKKGLDDKSARESAIVIGESIIEGAVPLTMTRNKINRFDASTQDGALYTEISYFGGNTTLEIMLKKSEEYFDENATKYARKCVDYKPVLGLLMLVARDIENGYVAIGGQTAVGRGIFASNGTIEISEASVTEADCRKALYQYLQEVEGDAVQ